MVEYNQLITISHLSIKGFIKFRMGLLDYLNHQFSEGIIKFPMENNLNLLYYITNHQIPINLLNHFTNRQVTLYCS